MDDDVDWQSLSEEDSPSFSALVMTVKALWYVPLQIWRCRPSNALIITDQVCRGTGTGWMLWHVTLIVNAALLGFVLTDSFLKSDGATTISEGAELGQTTLNVSSGWPIGFVAEPFGGVFALVLMFVVLALFVGLVLRATGLYWVRYRELPVGGAAVSLRDTMTVFATSQMLYTVPLTACAVLEGFDLLSGHRWVAVPLAAVLFGADIAFNYWAILRVGTPRPVLARFLWSTLVSLVLAVTVLVVFLRAACLI